MQIPHRSILFLGGCVLLGSVFTFQFFSDRHLATEASEPTPNWDKKLPSASRFIPLGDFGGAAVRDEETGLVWETTLETTERSWTDARAVCADKDLGGGKAGGCLRSLNCRACWILLSEHVRRFLWAIPLSIFRTCTGRQPP